MTFVVYYSISLFDCKWHFHVVLVVMWKLYTKELIDGSVLAYRVVDLQV